MKTWNGLSETSVRPCGRDGCCICPRAAAHPICPCITAGRPASSQTLPFRPHKRLCAGAALALSPAWTGHSCRHNNTEGRQVNKRRNGKPCLRMHAWSDVWMEGKCRAPAPRRVLAPLPAQGLPPSSTTYSLDGKEKKARRKNITHLPQAAYLHPSRFKASTPSSARLWCTAYQPSTPPVPDEKQKTARKEKHSAPAPGRVLAPLPVEILHIQLAHCVGGGGNRHHAARAALQQQETGWHWPTVRGSMQLIPAHTSSRSLNTSPLPSSWAAAAG